MVRKGQILACLMMIWTWSVRERKELKMTGAFLWPGQQKNGGALDWDWEAEAGAGLRKERNREPGLWGSQEGSQIVSLEVGRSLG